MAHSKFSLRHALQAPAMVLVAGFLLGCGASPSPIPTIVYPSVTGNWEFELQVSPPVGSTFPNSIPPIQGMFGSLSSSGGKVTGILNAQTPVLFGSGCIAANADLLATGIIDTVGNLTLTVPISGGVATITATSTTPSRPFLDGTFQVIGGPCAQPLTALTAYEVPNITGTYTGTLTQAIPISTPAPTVVVTATFVQATTPNVDGEYPLTGTVTITGACSATLSFTQGLVLGGAMQSYPDPTFTFIPANSFFGSIPPGTQQPSILGNVYQFPGCGITTYIGVLNRQ